MPDQQRQNRCSVLHSPRGIVPTIPIVPKVVPLSPPKGGGQGTTLLALSLDGGDNPGTTGDNPSFYPYESCPPGWGQPHGKRTLSGYSSRGYCPRGPGTTQKVVGKPANASKAAVAASETSASRGSRFSLHFGPRPSDLSSQGPGSVSRGKRPPASVACTAFVPLFRGSETARNAHLTENKGETK